MTKRKRDKHKYKEDGIRHMKQRKREQNIDRDRMPETKPLRDRERPGLKGRFRGTDRVTGEMGMERQS